MRFIGKKGKAYECFADFKKGCNAKEYQQFVDIFLPMLFQENNNRLAISVGKKVAETKFVSWLSMVTHKFTAIPTMYGNEPQLIIRDGTNLNNTLINLALIKDLHIDTEETVNDYRYQICFNYNNEVDYQMHIVVNRE